MPETKEMNVVAIPTGYRSAEVASFIAQLDDQLRRLTANTRGLTPARLAWQPAPGMNTIGMLLAHLAVVEVWWTGFALAGLDRDKVPFQEVLGLTGDDDGMPLPENGRPPAALTGRDLAFYDDLLARARGYIKKVSAELTDEDLTRTLERTRPTGEIRVIELRWALYHMLEHFAGHFGQILLLQHAHRAGLQVREHAPSGSNGARHVTARRPAKGKRVGAKRRGKAKPRRAVARRAKPKRRAGAKRRR